DLRQHKGKACYSFGYKWYGSADDWEMLLNTLNQAPPEFRVFNELILQDTPVKPYLDIEWYVVEGAGVPDADTVRRVIKEGIVEIFKNTWKIKLDPSSNIYFANCDRQVREHGVPKEKKSSHVIIHSGDHPVHFANANDASFLAQELKKYLKTRNEALLGNSDAAAVIPEGIVDLGVYKKTQNFRLVGHTKEGQPAHPLWPTQGSPLDYIVTHVNPPESRLLPVPEQDGGGEAFRRLRQCINPVNPFADIENNEAVVEQADLILGE